MTCLALSIPRQRLQILPGLFVAAFGQQDSLILQQVHVLGEMLTGENWRSFTPPSLKIAAV